MSSSRHTPSFHLAPRSKHEEHRAATPLELMFDLAAVIAIAAAATGLHHAVAESHFIDGIIGFLMSFFMIWWAWMNYTWFASAYDNGSSWFRILSMAIMFGALVLAAGIPAVFSGQPLYLALSGFIIMRLCLVVLWLAAARGDPEHRPAALRYGSGIALMQLYWIVIVLVLPAGSNAILLAFLLGFAGELGVPAFAERTSRTSWHRHHIIERYVCSTLSYWESAFWQSFWHWGQDLETEKLHGRCWKLVPLPRLSPLRCGRCISQMKSIYTAKN